MSDEQQTNTQNQENSENTVSTDGKASTESKSDDTQKTKTIEVPITTYEEALAWGMKELGKQRRKSGHKIELKVIGNTDFKVGEWVHVFIPKYNEECFMFISKASVEAGADEEFIVSLTLVDYPPSLGAGKSNISSGSESSDDDESNNSNSGSDSDDAQNKSTRALEQQSQTGSSSAS